ncbi:hypothetical protein [Paenibacillus humicola]|uniref:hypothetical protein n=1 Tax=Paenibacillus humicola TaxID=3110540 RepID=UPI00237AC16D|nr:hypothetical protein [Paenibacillus humicola]
MTVSKMLLSFSFGLVIALLAIGLLPFLLIYAWIDINGLSDAYPLPFFILPKFLRSDKSNDRPAK